MNDDEIDEVAALDYMLGFISQMMVVTAQFAAHLYSLGCTCPWGPPVELTKEEVEDEERRVAPSRRYQLIIGVQPDFKDVTGYEYAAVARHIEHHADCGVGQAIMSRTN